VREFDAKWSRHSAKIGMLVHEPPQARPTLPTCPIVVELVYIKNNKYSLDSSIKVLGKVSFGNANKAVVNNM